MTGTFIDIIDYLVDSFGPYRGLYVSMKFPT
jgi:hypothetical protein